MGPDGRCWQRSEIPSGPTGRSASGIRKGPAVPTPSRIEPGRNGLLFEPGSARELARELMWAEAFPEKVRQMGECARADYLARFISHWSYPTLFGERRRSARA